METLLITIGISILIAIAYLVYIDQRILKRVVTYKRDEARLKINDERYHELNNKIQLLIAVSSIIILIAGFIGYNSISNIKKEINDDIEHYKISLQQYDTTLKYYEKLITSLENERKNLTNIIKASIDETNRLQNVLIQLQKDYSFNVRTYLVADIPFEKRKIKDTEDFEKVRVYFKNLRTTDGKILPQFKSPPFVSIQNIGFAFLIKIKEITLDYFEYEPGEVSTLDEKTGIEEPIFPISKFDILITTNK